MDYIILAVVPLHISRRNVGNICKKLADCSIFGFIISATLNRNSLTNFNLFHFHLPPFVCAVFLTVTIYYHSFTLLSTGNSEIIKKHFPSSIKARRETFATVQAQPKPTGAQRGNTKEVIVCGNNILATPPVPVMV
jgi:hypothetical protein